MLSLPLSNRHGWSCNSHCWSTLRLSPFVSGHLPLTSEARAFGRDARDRVVEGIEWSASFQVASIATQWGTWGEQVAGKSGLLRWWNLTWSVTKAPFVLMSPFGILCGFIIMEIIWWTPWIKFTFNRCLHSLAAAEPAKYKRNIKKTKKIVASGNKWFSNLHLISARLAVGPRNRHWRKLTSI